MMMVDSSSGRPSFPLLIILIRATYPFFDHLIRVQNGGIKTLLRKTFDSLTARAKSPSSLKTAEIKGGPRDDMDLSEGSDDDDDDG